VPARHATTPRRSPRRSLRSVVAGLAAGVGIVSLVAGSLVLAHEPAVVAGSFGPTTTAGTERATSRPSGPRPSARRTAPPEAGIPAKRVGEALTARARGAVPPRQVSFTDAGVVADVVPVGVLGSGALQIPADPSRIGWWAAGAMPGQSEGSVVLAGHMDGLSHGGAMSVLLDVQEGDTVAVQDRRGSTHRYRVVARGTQPRQNIDPALFTTDGPHRLVLITCGGTYDERAGQYTDNIVVIAQPANGE
jgi:hypothetical protein